LPCIFMKRHGIPKCGDNMRNKVGILFPEINHPKTIGGVVVNLRDFAAKSRQRQNQNKSDDLEFFQWIEKIWMY